MNPRLIPTPLILILLASVAGACEHEKPCEDGFEPSGSNCVVAPEPEVDGAAEAMDAMDAMDAMIDDGGGTDMPGEEPADDELLGAVCASDADCGGGTPFCAKGPSSPEGYCTIRDCDVDDDQCPDGYACFRLGIPVVPDFCQVE